MNSETVSRETWRAARGAGGAAATAFGAGLFLIGLLVLWIDPALDRSLHARWLLHADAPSLRWLRYLTELGGGTVLIPLALCAAVLLRVRGDGRAALWLFATIASGRLVVEGAKPVFGRLRPPEGDWLASASSLSFPSSHSAGSMLTGLALCLALGARRPAFVAALLFSVAVGATRVMLGMHWPSDVLAGWGFGLFWACGAAVLVRPRGPAWPCGRNAGDRA